MKKIIIPAIILIMILAVAGIYFLNQPKTLASMSDAQFPEQPLVIRYDKEVYEELLKNLPEDFIVADIDKDGIANKEEIDLGLSPYTEDSDGDGISDYEEINIYDSDPLKWSTADDGISDYAKITKHLSINSPIQNDTLETIRISDEIQLIPEDINSETLYIFSGYNGEAFNNLTPIIPPFRLYDFLGKVKIDLSAFQPKEVYVYFYNSLSGKVELWNDVTKDPQQLEINFDEVLSGKPVVIAKDSISKIEEWIKGLFHNIKKHTVNNTNEDMDYQPGYIANSGFQIDKHSFSFSNMPLDCSPDGICSGFAFATNQIYNGMNPSRKMNKNTLSIPIIGEIKAAPAFDTKSEEYDVIFKDKTPFRYKVTDAAITNYDSKGEPQESYTTVNISDISQPDQELLKCLSNYWLWSNKTTLYDSAVSALSNYKLNNEFSKIREIADLFKKNQIIHVSLDGGIGGHAVNAYKLEQDKNDTDLFYLYIYDNNYPNNMMLFRNPDGSLRKQQTDIYMTIRRYPKKTLVGVYEMFDFSYGTGTYTWRNDDDANPAGVRFYRSLEEMRMIEIEGTSHEYWERYTGISLEVPEQIEYDTEMPIKVIAVDSLGIPRDITKNLDCSIMIPNDLFAAGCLKDGNILYFDKKDIGTDYREFTVTVNFRGLKASKTVTIGDNEDKPETQTTPAANEHFVYSTRNILRGGLYTYDGQWIYYCNPYSDELYKIKPDLTENTFICSESPHFINVWHDEIIYTYGEFQISGVKKDGSNQRIVIEAIGEDSPIVFYNNRLLVDFEGIYHFDINDIEDSYTYYEDKNEPFLYDGWIYYRDLEQNAYNKMRPDMSEDQVVIPDFNLFQCVVDDGWVYGFDYDTGQLMRISLTDKTSQGISGEDWFNKGYRMAYTVSKGYVYFENEEDENRLYRINCDTGVIEAVSLEGNVHDFGIAGGWIFYESGDNAHIVSEDLNTRINGEDFLRPIE